MTQEEIRKRRWELQEKFNEAQRGYLEECSDFLMRMEELKEECPHVGTRSETSSGGDYFKECLDCGEYWL